MTTFRSQLGRHAVLGNAGVRYVRTKVLSKGFRGEVTVVPSTGGSAATVVSPPPNTRWRRSRGTGGYEYFLPSVNVAFDLNDITKLRLAGYRRALSRSGIEDFNVGITAGRPTPPPPTVEGVLANSTTGNPDLKPIRGWNLDASLEFYVNRDTSFAIATVLQVARRGRRSTLSNRCRPPHRRQRPVDHHQRHRAGQRPRDPPPVRRRVQRQPRVQLPAGPLSGLGASWLSRRSPKPTSSSLIRRPSRPMSRPANLTRPLQVHGQRLGLLGERQALQLRASYRYRSDYFQAQQQHQPQRQGVRLS